MICIVWADNNFVKNLFNFHSPVIVRGGMMRKKRDQRAKRKERDQSEVDCSEQQKVYYLTYHLINKGYCFKAKYDLATESHLHGWPLKPAAGYYSMNINNTNKVFCYFYKKYHTMFKLYQN
jgi:hypothetical protein